MRNIKQAIDFFLLPRSTRELARLNKIWDRFNRTKEDPLPKLLKHSWKHQTDKVILLIDVSRGCRGVEKRLVKHLFEPPKGE